MALNWSLRSDNGSFLAWRAPGGNVAAKMFTVAGVVPTVAADAGAISGQVYSLHDISNTASKGLAYSANNVFTGAAFSILMRIKFKATTAHAIYDIGHLGIANNCRLFFYSAASQFRCSLYDQNGVVILNGQILHATTHGLDVFYDVVITWDGTTAANSFKFWRDGSNVNSFTPSLSGARANSNASVISVGITGLGITTNSFFINEMVIWDEVIDPSPSGLNLSGASRSTFVAADSFNGLDVQGGGGGGGGKGLGGFG